MRCRITTWAATAALLSATVPAAAQTKDAKGDHVDLIGCVQFEQDYREALGAAKGGPLGSGAGQGNEYVLVAGKAAPERGITSTNASPRGTAGESGDYLLTGKSEDELKRAVGRRIEVVGEVLPFRANKNATEDRNRLPRLSITAWHPVQDYCTPAGRK